MEVSGPFSFFGAKMPWKPEDAKRHTKKARSATAQRQWSHVANSMLESGRSEGQAVAGANSVIKKRGIMKRKKKGRGKHRY